MGTFRAYIIAARFHPKPRAELLSNCRLSDLSYMQRKISIVACIVS